jgi:flagellar basal body-associated protein FliL
VKRKRFHSYILLTILGFALIMAAVLFMFFQFSGIMAHQEKLNSDFYKEYINNLNNSLLSDMSRHIEDHYPVLRDTDLLKREAGTGWFWDIADEWNELAGTFNFAYIYYIEKDVDNDNYVFLMSSGIRRDKNPEWLGGPVWEGKPPAFIDEAWETKRVTFSPEPTINEWGALVSIERPIISDGLVAGILGIDYDISFVNRLKDDELMLLKQETEMKRRLIIIFAVTILIVIAIVIYLLWVNKTSVMVSAKIVKENEAEEAAKTIGILENILNSVDAMIYVNVPKTGEILFINNSMKECYGVNSDCSGQLCYKLFQKDQDGVCDFCPCFKLDKNPDQTVEWIESSAITNRTYRNTDRYIEWPGGEVVHLQHSVDITELITLQRELETALEDAKEANRAKSDFLATMSHEIRTPMNTIMGITEMQLYEERLTENLKETFERIYFSRDLLLNIINDLLDL